MVQGQALLFGDIVVPSNPALLLDSGEGRKPQM